MLISFISVDLNYRTHHFKTIFWGRRGTDVDPSHFQLSAIRLYHISG